MCRKLPDETGQRMIMNLIRIDVRSHPVLRCFVGGDSGPIEYVAKRIKRDGSRSTLETKPLLSGRDSERV